MAVVTKLSTFLTNRDAVPKVLTDPFIAGGQVSAQYGFASVTTGDSINSAYKLVSIPSNARVIALTYVNGALGASVTADVGVWYPTAIPQGGANFLAASLAGTLVGSVSNLINAGIAMASAQNTFTEALSLANLTAAQMEQPLWQMVGLSTDPELSFDVGFVLKGAAAGSSGSVVMKALYQA
jgi:hypothetical protein